jgi:TolB-like protein
VRRALTRFYLIEGVRSAGMRIHIPTGGYVAVFDSAGADRPAGYASQDKHPITVHLFEAEGDLPALNHGLTRRIIIGLHVRGTLVCGPEIGNRPALRQDLDDRYDSPTFVLTGSMAMFGDTFNVTAVLQDRSSGRVLWGQNFLRQIAAGLLLPVRDEIAEGIAEALHDFLAIQAHDFRRARISGESSLRWRLAS